MNRRKGVLTRVCAICLLLLAMSPLTAPFSTLDVATLSGHASPHDSTKLNVKPSSEGASLPVAVAAVLTSLVHSFRRVIAPPRLTDRLQAERGVLRI